MADEDRIMDLLIRWESLRSEGKLLTPEELCPDDPLTREALRPRLARRLRLAPFLGPPAEALPSGEGLPSVPGYEVQEVIGQGGMGIVYKARQAKLDRPVAVKMIRAGALPSDLARFRTEAEAVARLQHPNIVQIYEVGEHAGRPHLVLEWVAGGSLAQHLDGAPLPPRAAAALLLPLAEAVAFAHAQGVVHRDLKPANVLLSFSREPAGAPADALPYRVAAKRGLAELSATPKIADFGLAKRLDLDEGHTQTGQVLGTPCYMAPEQAEGRTRDVGPLTDVYALGAILYELLTGRPPFAGSTALETLMQVREHDPVPPTRLQPLVEHDLEVICLKCLHKSPADRYASASVLAADLRAYLDGEPIGARSATALEQVARAIRHHNLDERVAAVGNAYLWASPIYTLLHAAAYALWQRSPHFPAIISLVTMLSVGMSPLVALTSRPAVMRLIPRWLRRRLWTVWLANIVSLWLALLVCWQSAPAEEPERLLLVYPVWLLLAGLSWVAFTDLLGIYYVNSLMSFAAAVLSVFLPFWAPLITALTASLNMVVIGLFLRAVHRAIVPQAPPLEPAPTVQAAPPPSPHEGAGADLDLRR
jgi:serine/threonine protein kinase